MQVSTDAGATWTDVGTAVPRYDGSVGWKKHIVDISANAGAAVCALVQCHQRLGATTYN
ncbi:MAG: hypothetical protein IPK53_07725 [bacterium]|nr:hypothetical protein [bacterium]